MICQIVPKLGSSSPFLQSSLVPQFSSLWSVSRAITVTTCQVAWDTMNYVKWTPIWLHQMWMIMRVGTRTNYLQEDHLIWAVYLKLGSSRQWGLIKAWPMATCFQNWHTCSAPVIITAMEMLPILWLQMVFWQCQVLNTLTLFSFECFYTIHNIFLWRSGISLVPLFGHWGFNILNNVIMYVALYIPALIKVLLLQRMLTLNMFFCE